MARSVGRRKRKRKGVIFFGRFIKRRGEFFSFFASNYDTKNPCFVSCSSL